MQATSVLARSPSGPVPPVTISICWTEIVFFLKDCRECTCHHLTTCVLVYLSPPDHQQEHKSHKRDFLGELWEREDAWNSHCKTICYNKQSFWVAITFSSLVQQVLQCWSTRWHRRADYTHRPYRRSVSWCPLQPEQRFQRIFNGKYQKPKKTMLKVTLMEQWLYRGSSREKFSVVSRFPGNKNIAFT